MEGLGEVVRMGPDGGGKITARMPAVADSTLTKSRMPSRLPSVSIADSRFCVRSHSSEGSVSSPACFRAMIAREVSRMFSQWFSDSLFFNSVMHSSKMLSGVAMIVRANSWVVRVEQSAAFVSRHSKAASILSSLESSVDVVVLSAARVRDIENSTNNRVRDITLFFMVG